LRGHTPANAPKNRRVEGDSGGPHVRLGLAWAVVVVAAAVVGPVALAIPMLAAAALAVAELVRVGRPIGIAAVVLAAASPVVVELQAGRVAAVVMLLAVCLYDAAVFIVGTGGRNRWEGPAAGVLALVPFTVIVASVLQPPFDGNSGWVLGGLTAALAPWGSPLATRLAGGGPGRYPGLRRLDTLLLVGPAWMIAVAVLGVG
jgi:hypothetical protein